MPDVYLIATAARHRDGCLELRDNLSGGRRVVAAGAGLAGNDLVDDRHPDLISPTSAGPGADGAAPSRQTASAVAIPRQTTLERSRAVRPTVLAAAHRAARSAQPHRLRRPLHDV